jgi:hypothetical protein
VIGNRLVARSTSTVVADLEKGEGGLAANCAFDKALAYALAIAAMN